jgi:hypothetical protein
MRRCRMPSARSLATPKKVTIPDVASLAPQPIAIQAQLERARKAFALGSLKATGVRRLVAAGQLPGGSIFMPGLNPIFRSVAAAAFIVNVGYEHRALDGNARCNVVACLTHGVSNHPAIEHCHPGRFAAGRTDWVRIPMISPGCTDLISPRIPR